MLYVEPLFWARISVYRRARCHRRIEPRLLSLSPSSERVHSIMQGRLLRRPQLLYGAQIHPPYQGMHDGRSSACSPAAAAAATSYSLLHSIPAVAITGDASHGRHHLCPGQLNVARHANLRCTRVPPSQRAAPSSWLTTSTWSGTLHARVRRCLVVSVHPQAAGAMPSGFVVAWVQTTG